MRKIFLLGIALSTFLPMSAQAGWWNWGGNARAQSTPISTPAFRLWVGPETSSDTTRTGYQVVWEVAGEGCSQNPLRNAAKGILFFMGADGGLNEIKLGRTQAAELRSSLCQGVMNDYANPYFRTADMNDAAVFVAMPNSLSPARGWRTGDATKVSWKTTKVMALEGPTVSGWRCVSTKRGDPGCKNGVDPFAERR